MNVSDKNALLAAVTLRDTRWAAVVARDADADGRFYYSVKTTDVYCKPSCAARTARPENVAFHASCAEAEAAGFRPCRRCRPGQPSLAEVHVATIARICRQLNGSGHGQQMGQSETDLSLAALAADAGMSIYHFHRIFKAVTGLTPKAYSAAQRETRMRNALGNGSRVTEAIYGAGYNSSSRFYEKSSQVLGMTPSSYREGGAKTEIRFAIGECMLGSILVASSNVGVCAILLGDDPGQLARDLQDAFPRADLIGGDGEFEQLVARVVGAIEAPASGSALFGQLPLDIRGTAFQQRVWNALRHIPPGSTVSYTDIARAIGSPNAVRAVAGACAANTLAVAIPCHRVVRTDGSISGYRWGVERKRTLLELEGGNAGNPTRTFLNEYYIIK